MKKAPPPLPTNRPQPRPRSHTQGPNGPSCEKCGTTEAQLYTLCLRSAVSVILFTIRKKKNHLLCSSCGVKQAQDHSIQTLALGWWGIPVGPIASFIALFGNAMATNKLGNRALSLWATAFAPIVLPVVLILAVFALRNTPLSAGGKDTIAIAGKEEFDAANSLIIGHAKGTHHGNTDEAKKLAESFSGQMAAMEKVFFKGGKEKRTFSLTNEQFSYLLPDRRRHDCVFSSCAAIQTIQRRRSRYADLNCLVDGRKCGGRIQAR